MTYYSSTNLYGYNTAGKAADLLSGLRGDEWNVCLVSVCPLVEPQPSMVVSTVLLSVSCLSCLPGIYLRQDQNVHTMKPFTKKKVVQQKRSDVFR